MPLFVKCKHLTLHIYQDCFSQYILCFNVYVLDHIHIGPNGIITYAKNTSDTGFNCVDTKKLQ
jgi:hypothetical protein